MKRVFLLIIMLLLLAACQEKEKIIITMPTLAEFPTAIPTSTLTPTATLSPTPSPLPSATLTPSPTLTLAPSITPAPLLTATPTLFQGLSDQIDRTGLMQVIGAMQNFGSRHVNAIHRNGMTGIDAARQYLLNQLNLRASSCAVPARVLEDTFTVRFDGQRTQQANLVAEVPGTQSDNGVIIIGGHYDTIHGAEPEDEDIDQPGADDNGSGVAAILELMRLICMTPHPQTFVFVLFAAEEPDEGRLGSRSFVQDFIPTTSWRVEAMLNLDTIGSSTDERGAIKDDFARLYSSGPISCCARQLARNIQAAAFVQLPDFRLNVEDSIDRLFRWGDHMSFTEMNYPAVRLFEGSEDVVRQDTQRDLINDIDPNYLAKNIQVVLAYLLGVSEGVTPPQNLIVNGTTATWAAVPGAQAYLVVQRPPNESNYVVMTQVNGTSVTLPAETIFAVGSIGANGLLGELSAENYIAP